MTIQLITVSRGERGDPGAKGDPGATFSISTHQNDPNSHPDIRALLASKASSYQHNQTTSSTSWIIIHNLNRYPSVVTVLYDGSSAQGSIIHNSYNVCSVVFAVSVYGTACCV